MTCRIWSTFGTANPSKITIAQETTVTYSTIEDNVERVNDAFSSTYVAEGWPSWGVIRTLTAPRMDADSSPKKRKRKSAQGPEVEVITQKKLKGHLKRCPLGLDFESWTPCLDGSTWPETVYHLEYRRADSSLAERVAKAEEPFADSESTGLLSEHKIEAEVNHNFAGADGTNCTTNPGTQQLRIKWSLAEETWVIMTGLEPHPFADEDRRCELQANYRILDEATQQLEKMLSGIGDTKIIASKILSRLDFVEITLLSCTIVVGEPFLDRQKSENWTQQERRAFRRKYDHAVRLSWILDDILGRWEQLSKFLVHEVDIWRPEACCNMVWEAGHYDGTYLELLADLEHSNQHRLCEATRMKMNHRSRCVITWDLANLDVNVLCC